MKKQLIFLVTLFVALTVFAVPAKHGVWRTLQLADGTEVRAQLCGDERTHFWKSEDGTLYFSDDSSQSFSVTTRQQIVRRMANRGRRVARPHSAQRSLKARRSAFTGTKRGLVILAQFSDKSFASGHGKQLYNNILNAVNYTDDNGFQGSVRDYFKDQSGGLFDLQFDVIGPITLSKTQSYYGSNDSDGNDKHPAEMVIEACKAADAQVDFSNYDWSGDGEVDQVYVVYAGKGEADSGVSNTIWPHEWDLTSAETYGDGSGAITLDGVTIDTYACGSELDAGSHIEGIGTFCHEFSHCLGYPDTYDTEYAGYFGMGDLDLMCSGSYNGGGFVPAGYTAYEKWQAGWLEPIVLSDENLEVTNLEPLSEGGDAYVIYNEAHTDEYYLIENRQLTVWDKELPCRGLMITHVDYDAKAWYWNIVNSVVDYSSYGGSYVGVSNDHERLTIFHADNEDDKRYWRQTYYSKTTTATDLYPYQSNDSLTNTSRPAATLYNANTDGKKLLNRALLDITQNDDGTVSFIYRAQGSETSGGGDTPVDGVLFYESFDANDGTGGNDDKWSGSIATKTLLFDNEGWDVLKGYGGDACARFGSSSVSGSATTPAITLSGDATLTFRASAWDASKDKDELTLSVSGGSVTPSSFTLPKGQWGDFSATLSGSGTVTVNFSTASRFFLDEVVLTDASTGIRGVEDVPSAASRLVYDLSGRCLGYVTLQCLPRGIYVRGGKKVVIR